VVEGDVVEVLEAAGAAEEEEGEVGVEADQEIGPAKTAVTPTLLGGTCATSVRHQSLEVAVEEVVVAEVEVGALVVVGTETEVTDTEVVEVTGTEVVEDTTETGMEVDMVAAAEVLIEEAMAETGTDHTDLDQGPSMEEKLYCDAFCPVFIQL